MKMGDVIYKDAYISDDGITYPELTVIGKGGNKICAKTASGNIELLNVRDKGLVWHKTKQGSLNEYIRFTQSEIDNLQDEIEYRQRVQESKRKSLAIAKACK